LASGYVPESVPLPNGYVVFRGVDARSRMVLAVPTGATGTGASAPHDTEKAPPVGLQLSYILDPSDAYQVPKGQF
jgi:hypothetical protein